MGFMIKFESGLTVCFAGSTAPTLDMTMWGRMYKPDVAILQMSAANDPQDLVEEIKMLAPSMTSGQSFSHLVWISRYRLRTDIDGPSNRLKHHPVLMVCRQIIGCDRGLDDYLLYPSVVSVCQVALSRNPAGD